MMQSQKQRLRQIAEAFVAELPPEYIETILGDPNFIVPFEKPVTKARSHHIGIGAKRSTMIENKAIEVRNRYYTSLLRDELRKIYPKTQ